MAIGETARLIASLELDPRKFLRGADQALGKLRSLEGGVGRMGRGVGQLGTGLARAGVIIGGAVVTGVAGAAKAAIDFEDAFAGVRKTVDEADLTAVGLSFDILARRFRDMATEIPIAATEFARIGETAGALGIKAKDIEGFTKTVSLLGVTTNLSSDQAAEALGKLGTILGLTGDDFTEFADALVNLGNKGASTESEIIETAKRFAGVGRAAGLTKEQILALSSAVTSLGAEPEAGGSALSRIFSNMGTEIANATTKGKAFSKLTGRSFQELSKRINKGDSLGIFRDTIKGLAALETRTEKFKFLKALGITNVRDRDAIIKISNDVGVLDDALKAATESTGALGVEAQKRFDTIRSKLTLLKNNAIEAGITIGEGMLPAIGRATDKLVAFLKDPVNKGQLKALGEDIGAAIDRIEWDKVLQGAKDFVGILKDAGGFAISILETLNKLPTEVKAAGLGLIGLNKLSGGLVSAGLGNIIGGLAETITRSFGSKLPGVGKLFAQPVFVTNWPMGGLPPGVNPAAAAGGAAGAVGALAAGALLVDQLIHLPDQLGALGEGFDALSNKDLPGARQGLQDFADAMPDLTNPFAPSKELIQAIIDNIPVPPMTEAERAQDTREIDRIITQSGGETRAAIEKHKDSTEATRIELATKLGAVQGAINSTSATTALKVAAARDAVESLRISNASQQSSTRTAGHSDTDRIVQAIQRSAPKISVFVDKGDPGDRGGGKGGGGVLVTTKPTGPGHGS